MRARSGTLLLAGLLLAAPLAAAAVEPPQDPWKRTFCFELGCVQTDDRDRDGEADWANVALAGADAWFLNLNVNRTNGTNVTWWGGATTEEHEPLHGPDDKALGVDSWGYANLTGRGEEPGFNDTEANLLAYWTDHETGEFELIREELVYAGDSDEDGRPDRFHPRLLP